MDAGLCPSCSLNVLVQTPIIAPQPVVPGAWIPATTAADDTQGPIPMDIAQDAGTVTYQPHFGNNGQDENDSDGSENGNGGDGSNDDGGDDDEEEDDGDHDMHALPVFNPNHPFALPGMGRGRGRGRGHGRGGMPFSGAGHSLGSSGPTSAATDDQGPTHPELTSEERDQERRQRVLEAMALRAKVHEARSTVQPIGPKRVKERELPSLQSLCCYQVAGENFVNYALFLPEAIDVQMQRLLTKVV